jgi:hypothetical protein
MYKWHRCICLVEFFDFICLYSSFVYTLSKIQSKLYVVDQKLSVPNIFGTEGVLHMQLAAFAYAMNQPCN